MPMRLIQCAVCESEFEHNHPDAAFCSNKCKQVNKYNKIRGGYKSIDCRQCGIEIFTNDRRVKYCSAECHMVSRIMKR